MSRTGSHSSNEPLALGLTALIIGIVWWILGPSVYELIGSRTRGWAFLLIIVGLAIVVTRLWNMAR